MKTRMALVYAHLLNADQIVSEKVTLPKEEIKKTTDTMAREDMVKVCKTLVDNITKRLPNTPTSQRPELLAHMKNAMLRLTADREENHTDHVTWAQANPRETNRYIRDYAKTIREALEKL